MRGAQAANGGAAVTTVVVGYRNRVLDRSLSHGEYNEIYGAEKIRRREMVCEWRSRLAALEKLLARRWRVLRMADEIRDRPRLKLQDRAPGPKPIPA